MPVPPCSHTGTWHSCEQVLVLDMAHVWCVHRHAQAGTQQGCPYHHMMTLGHGKYKHTQAQAL